MCVEKMDYYTQWKANYFGDVSFFCSDVIYCVMSLGKIRSVTSLSMYGELV